MKTKNQVVLVALLMLAVLFLAACGGNESNSGHNEPYHLEADESSGFNRVILEEQAAERLGIDTAEVSEGDVIEAQTIRGQVTDASGKVRVALNKQIVDRVDTHQVVVLADDDDDDGWLAELLEGPEANDEEGEEDDGDADDADEVLFFSLDNSQQALSQGQTVFVKLPMAGGPTNELVVPYSAVLYGLNGESWVYINTGALEYMRFPIIIERIDGGDAILSYGPPAGSDVVTVGVAELYGADTGVGK